MDTLIFYVHTYYILCVGEYTLIIKVPYVVVASDVVCEVDMHG